MLSNVEKEVWNVYFIIDTTKSVDIETQKQYEIVLSKIIQKYRSNSRLYENCLINIITFGNDQAKFIIKGHPLEEPIHLNLKFSGEGSIVDGIDLLEESIIQIKDKRYYSPVTISFVCEECTNSIAKKLLTFNKSRYYRPFHYDYPEIFINEFIDENYLVLFNNETIKTYNPEICNIVLYEKINEFAFEGEIREKDEINLQKIKLPKSSINIIE